MIYYIQTDLRIDLAIEINDRKKKKKLAKREKHHPLYSGLWYRNHVKYDD